MEWLAFVLDSDLHSGLFLMSFYCGIHGYLRLFFPPHGRNSKKAEGYSLGLLKWLSLKLDQCFLSPCLIGSKQVQNQAPGRHLQRAWVLYVLLGGTEELGSVNFTGCFSRTLGVGAGVQWKGLQSWPYYHLYFFFLGLSNQVPLTRSSWPIKLNLHV